MPDAIVCQTPLFACWTPLFAGRHCLHGGRQDVLKKDVGTVITACVVSSFCATLNGTVLESSIVS
jgi:hypothetical protein